MSGSALIDTWCPPDGGEKNGSFIPTTGSENWLSGEGTAVTGLSGSLLRTVSSFTWDTITVGTSLLSRLVSNEEILAIE